MLCTGLNTVDSVIKTQGVEARVSADGSLKDIPSFQRIFVKWKSYNSWLKYGQKRCTPPSPQTRGTFLGGGGALIGEFMVSNVWFTEQVSYSEILNSYLLNSRLFFFKFKFIKMGFLESKVQYFAVYLALPACTTLNQAFITTELCSN